MMKKGKIIGVDVGGTHISAGYIEKDARGKKPLELVRKEMNAFGFAGEIIHSISACIGELTKGETYVELVGIAFPGPADYENGILKVMNVGGKFERCFGLHILDALKDETGLTNTTFVLSNDAHCFAIGVSNRYRLSGAKNIFLTLGTGFGSAVMEDGKILQQSPILGISGAFYDKPFLDGKADDYFSTRWFLSEYGKRTGRTILSVKDLAKADDPVSKVLFQEFGNNIGAFIKPLIEEYQIEGVVIGGNICRSAGLFIPALLNRLNGLKKPAEIIVCDDTEECILTGAALLAEEKPIPKTISSGSKRKATQPLLPLTANRNPGTGYNVYPFTSSGQAVYRGFDALAERICLEKTVIIDGYGGVLWELFREDLKKALSKKNKRLFWYDIHSGLKNANSIHEIISDYVNEGDPVFGRKYHGSLGDFFEVENLKMIQPDNSADICIVYGTGAALSGWEGLLIYVDVPKNEIQYRMRAGSIKNIGSYAQLANTQTYKRFYFVDWPVLNKHKEKVLPVMDIIVDEQRIQEITWMEGTDFRLTLENILSQPFRARPWFEAGVWGGHWMKKNIRGLNENEINYAWSFELITPENGIVIEGNQLLLEVSFDFLLYQNNLKLLGNAAEHFGKEFPIRFDFLDTYVGGNLSIQCHPRTDYIRKKFGETFTQDETYYILDCEKDAKVYLGFQEDINPTEFKTALFAAQDDGIELPVEKFVRKLDTNKHDLFLIPNGTIHASGKNNLVLEISSTPYIFTFKMYDWLRLDLNGQPRPINIEHAFENLYFDRKGNYVDQYLVSKPQIVNEWPQGRRVNLPTHARHFYKVERYEFTGTVTIEKVNQFHICMLVEGDSIDVLAEKTVNKFSYAETFVIPASVGTYLVTYHGNERAFLIVASMKEEYC